MGLWPFGRSKADVDATSRVVILRARDGVPMRAKVTLRLAEPQTQADADELAEACSDLVRAAVREAPTAPAVLGLESAIAAEVMARLPKETASVRSVEVAGLHIVGDPGHLAQAAALAPDVPAWLRAPPSSPSSSDARPVDRTLDRPTPIQPLPAAKPAPAPLPKAGAPAAKAPAPAAARAPEHLAPTALSPAPAPAEGPASPIESAALTTPSPVLQSVHHDPRTASAPATQQTPVVSAADTTAARDVPETGNHEPDAQVVSKVARPLDPFASTAVSPTPPAETSGARPTTQRPPARPAVSVGGRSASSPPGPRRPPSSPRFAAVAPPAGRLAPPGNPRFGSSPPAPLRPPSHPRMSAVSLAEEPAASSRGSMLHGPPSAGPRSAPSSPVGPSSRSASRPPPAAVAARRRVVAARLFLPSGAGPYEVARGLTPLFRDTAGRILVAFLRMYDLTVIRRVPFDAVETDILSSLTAPADGAPGTYLASHTTEIHRWRDAFGAAKMDLLHREANLAAAALAFEGLSTEGVPQSMANAVVDGLAGSAFGDPDMTIDLGRYLYPANETTSAETLVNMIAVAGEDMPPGLENALDPLFTSLREEVAAAALIAKDVMLNVS